MGPLSAVAWERWDVGFLHVIVAQEVSEGNWLAVGELRDSLEWVMLKALRGRCSCREAVVVV